MRVPQNGWFIREIPMKLDDFGGTPIHGIPHLSKLSKAEKALPSAGNLPNSRRCPVTENTQFEYPNTLSPDPTNSRWIGSHGSPRSQNNIRQWVRRTLHKASMSPIFSNSHRNSFEIDQKTPIFSGPKKNAFFQR